MAGLSLPAPTTRIDGKDLSVCIVTFNNEATITECLHRLKHAVPGASVTVVDNASSDRTVAKALQVLSGDSRILVSDLNVGFGAGMNKAVLATETPWALMLNPDAYLDPAFGASLEALDVAPDIALIAPRVMMSTGMRQPTPTPLPTMWMAFLRFSGLGRAASTRLGGTFVRRWSRLLGPTVASHATQEWLDSPSLPYAAATAVVIRREAFDDVGGFDESYFLYVEDADLCRALARRGWRVLGAPHLVVHHLVGASDPSFRRDRAEATEGLLYYWEKESPNKRRLVQLFALVFAGARVVAALGKGNLGARVDYLNAVLRWNAERHQRHRARAASAQYRVVSSGLGPGATPAQA